MADPLHSLISNLFAPADQLAHSLNEIEDELEAGYRFFGDFRQMWWSVTRTLDKTKIDDFPEGDLRTAIENISKLNQGARTQCISFPDVGIYLYRRRHFLSKASRRGWLAAKQGGVIPDDPVPVDELVAAIPPPVNQPAELAASNHLPKAADKSPSENLAEEATERKTHPSYQTIVSDAKSPLTRYAYFLTVICQDLGDLVDRDKQAIEILTTEPALPLAIQRAGLRVTNEITGRQLGRIFPTSRIWTRRDERRVLMDRGKLTGFYPMCRAGRYAHHVLPQFEELFRLAVHEARADGMLGMVGDLLNKSKTEFEHFSEAVRQASGQAHSFDRFNDARWRLAGVAAELTNWTKPPQEANAKSSEGSSIKERPEERTGLTPANETQSVGENSTVKFIAALNLHHRYENGSFLNSEPIGNNEIARRVGLSKKTASNFFRTKFGSYANYAQICQQRERFIGAMKALNSEFSPRDFVLARSPYDIEAGVD